LNRPLSGDRGRSGAIGGDRARAAPAGTDARGAAPACPGQTARLGYVKASMHPLVKGAAAVAVLTALGGLDHGSPPPPRVVEAPAKARGVDGLPALCAKGTLPEGPVCVRIPAEDEASARPADLGRARRAEEAIPRRPDRPADPARYRYPVEGQQVLGGFDVGATPQGVRLAAAPGETIKLVALDHQDGPAEVVFVADRPGAAAVATRHAVREGERTRVILLVFGHLDHVAPGLAVGAKLEAGAAIGFAAPKPPTEISLEARQVRESAAAKAGPLDEKRLTDTSLAIPIDLRNVLATR